MILYSFILKSNFCPYICTLLHDLLTFDVIQKSREIRLVEALATFPLKGKVLTPTFSDIPNWKL